MHPLKTSWQRKWLRLDAVSPELQTLADAAEAFCARWVKNDKSKTLLVIVGTFGSGKTHTAKAIGSFCTAAALNAFEKGGWDKLGSLPSTIFISWPSVASEFNEKNFSVMDDAIKSALTILDDIGAENDPWKICADKLCQILSRREKMFTVVTTNIEPAAWASKFDGRIEDRLLRNSIVIDISNVPSFSLRG